MTHLQGVIWSQNKAETKPPPFLQTAFDSIHLPNDPFFDDVLFLVVVFTLLFSSFIIIHRCQMCPGHTRARGSALPDNGSIPGHLLDALQQLPYSVRPPAGPQYSVGSGGGAFRNSQVRQDILWFNEF